MRLFEFLPSSPPFYRGTERRERELAKLVGQQNLFRDLGFFFSPPPLSLCPLSFKLPPPSLLTSQRACTWKSAREDRERRGARFKLYERENKGHINTHSHPFFARNCVSSHEPAVWRWVREGFLSERSSASTRSGLRLCVEDGLEPEPARP